MIKNIAFDMENVLADYMADGVCRHLMGDPEAHKRASTSVFVSLEWTLLDIGAMLEDMALKEMWARLGIEEEHSLATLCFNRWHKLNMRKKGGTEDVVRWLKFMGYGIYLCSNAFVRLLSRYKDVLPAADCFGSILFSADVLCLKPQKEIYDHLFRRFHLKPEEYFFVDDLELNIEGARRYGMGGYCFDDGNVEKLREVLAGLNWR